MFRSSCCLGLQERHESLKRFDTAAELGEIVGAALVDDEPGAVRTNEQREGASSLALRLLIRARTGEFEERSPQVRKLSHEGRAEAIA